MQGLPFCHITPTTLKAKISHNHLHDLAGNAFNGFVCLAVFTAAFTTVGFPNPERLATERSARMPAGPVAKVEKRLMLDSQDKEGDGDSEL